jgi:hypothetical protein
VGARFRDPGSLVSRLCRDIKRRAVDRLGAVWRDVVDRLV